MHKQAETPLHLGMLIAIEGIDGSGKSTLALRLHHELQAQRCETLLTREPGGTPVGCAIRRLLAEMSDLNERAEYLLFAADRAQHFAEVILPAMHAGKIVISDRLADSSLAYQGYGRQLDLQMISMVNRWAMQTIEPDLVLYIDVPIELALQRTQARASGEGSSPLDNEASDFLHHVREGFDIIFASRSNVIRLDGTRTIDQLASDALQAVMLRIAHQ